MSRISVAVGCCTFPVSLPACSSARGFPLHTVLQHGSSSAGHPLARICMGRLYQGNRHRAGYSEDLPLLSPVTRPSATLPSLPLVRCHLYTERTGSHGRKRHQRNRNPSMWQHGFGFVTSAQTWQPPGFEQRRESLMRIPSGIGSKGGRAQC